MRENRGILIPVFVFIPASEERVIFINIPVLYSNVLKNIGVEMRAKSILFLKFPKRGLSFLGGKNTPACLSRGLEKRGPSVAGVA
ncbi:MAG: hypothetical protein AAB858_01275 [Patescibacteria group bacterium]